MDHLHSAAFEGCGNGLSILGTVENIEKNINKKMIDDFVAANYTGPRMVLVGSGAVDQAELCDLGAKYFGALPSTETKSTSRTRFMGGDKREGNENIPLTHVAVAFGTPGATNPDAIKIRIIEQLLGSYSRDKGEAAYSCLTRAIVADFYDPHVGVMRTMELAPHNPIHSISGFWTPYSDAGLLGFYVIAEPGKPYSHNVETAVVFGMREIVRITQTMSDEEVERAKNQLKVQIMLQLDGTTNIADDIGRQVLTFGSRVPLEATFNIIDSVSKKDLIACAHNIIYDKDPVLACIGDLRQVPEYDVTRRLSYWNTV
jgi:processing peptidase subunit beta